MMRSRDRGYGRQRSFSMHLNVIIRTRKKRDNLIIVKPFVRKGMCLRFLQDVAINKWGYGWFTTRGIM